MLADGGLVQTAAGGGEAFCEVGGERHGPFLSWYAGGQVRADGRYERGARIGEWVFFHPTGAVAAVAELADDRLDGPFREWRVDRRAVRAGTTAAGQRTATWTEWWPTGHRKAEGAYRDGLQDGVWTHWSADGSPAGETTWS